MRRIISILAELAVLAFASSAQAATKPESYTVQTRDGTIYVEVMRPVGGRLGGSPPWPSSPIRRTPSSAETATLHVGCQPRGCARVWADVVGTGNSGGCYDYGGNREKRTGHDLVEWIARQPWSAGKVGMLGGSYNGATRRPRP